MGRFGIMVHRVVGVPMKTLTLALVLASATPALPQDVRPAPDPIETFNYILGTQTIGVKYGFTDKTRLVETAERIRQMGSNVLKICLSKTYCDDYALPRREDVHSLAELAANEPSFRTVLDMPFAYYPLWTYCFSSGWWADGFTEQERTSEYREVYDLATTLLSRYAGSGKTFLIGHWEGDWHLLGGTDANKSPSATAIAGMIDWLNVRQKAIDEAKRDHPAGGVRVMHYTEVNLVQKGLKGQACLSLDVLPHTAVDYVSYSSYDTINRCPGDTGPALREALDFIESRLPPKPGVEGKRVFIGEYGFPLELAKTPQRQEQYALDVCRVGLDWGCPFVLYWEMYCNEIVEGRHRGFWLIDDHNQRQPFYLTLEDYYRQAGRFVSEFRAHHGRLPTDAEFRKQALVILQQPQTKGKGAG
jgi:hypothetical protein